MVPFQQIQVDLLTNLCMLRRRCSAKVIKAIILLWSGIDNYTKKIAHERSIHWYVATCNALYLSHRARGVRPSFKACVSVAVPYSSVPQMYNVLLFLVPGASQTARRYEDQEQHTAIANRFYGALALNKRRYEGNSPSKDISTQSTSNNIPLKRNWSEYWPSKPVVWHTKMWYVITVWQSRRDQNVLLSCFR